jgi:hypothetical protein
MPKRIRWIVLAIAIAVLVGGGGLLYVQQMLAFPPMSAYDTTVISGKPETASCINKGGKAPLAIELVEHYDHT